MAPLPMTDRGGLRRWQAVLVGLTLVAVFLRELHTGPPVFNSDQAIPILMANAAHWTPFHLFFYGEDRFGAWPFLAAHGIAMGRPVSFQFLDAWALLLCLSGVIPAGKLTRPVWVVGALGYLIAFLVPPTRLILTEVCQPYCFQVAMLLWAWLSFRASVERPGIVRWVLAAALSVLAVWLASTSGPMLMALAVLEVWSAGGREKKVVLLPLFGVLADAALRAGYHRWVLAHFGERIETLIRLDRGHLFWNAEVVVRHLLRAHMAAPLLLAAIMSGVLWRRIRSDVLARTTLGLTLLAFANLPVLILLTHVRMNSYADRYFAPLYFFAVLAAAVGVAAWWERLERTVPLVLFAMSAGLVVLPRHEDDPSPRRALAEAMVARAHGPGAYVLDGYWNTYAYAALAPPGALIALPKQGDLNRMPWVTAGLATASSVFVGDSSLLKRGEPPPALVYQYGVRLELVRASVVSDAERSFALYVPSGRSAALPHPDMVDLDVRRGSGD